MALNELFIKNIKAQKRKMFRDERNLYLQVHPNGSKFWKYRYWENGKEKKFAIGRYPDVPLKEARVVRDQIALKISRGEKLKEESIREEVISFRNIADEWMKNRILPDKAKTYIEGIEQKLRNHILPVIGDKRMAEITPSVVLAMCRKIEALGIVETAVRCRQVVGQVFKYAIASGQADHEPTSALSGALKTRRHKHFAALTDPRKITALMRQINEYPFAIVRCALLFSAFTFCRPGEIRHAEWLEINFDRAEWKIPAEKMKMKRIHLIPLSIQCVKILHELRPLTNDQRWVFPSVRKDGKPMSENTVSMAMRAMGFSREEMTAHGFRGMASTILNENGFSSDIIERQLAHAEGNKIRAAYNHAEYLPERRKMMQWWADWLGNLLKSNMDTPT